MILKPDIKETLWGGDRLYQNFGKGEKTAFQGESYEASAREDFKSIILNGEFKGKSLNEVLKTHKKEILGDREDFPFLVKFIDANDTLSVQVHPIGKAEMWHILEADENSFLIKGFNKDVTKEEVLKSLDTGEIEKSLNKIPVKKGDTVFITPKTVHAIGKGILILEIQENSDTTYRLYDFLRKDKDGNLRELHIKDALENLDFNKVTKEKEQIEIINEFEELLIKNEFFTVKKLKNNFEKTVSGLSIVICLEGKAELDGLTLKKGDTALIPHIIKNAKLKVSGEAVLVY